MIDNLVQLRITARNMDRLYWMFLLGPVVIYFLGNIFYSGFREFWNDFIMGMGTLLFIFVFFMLCLIHEALHVLACMAAGAKFKSFYFGYDKANLSILFCCRDEISVQGYQFMLLLPFFVLTPIPHTYLWLLNF